jgi:hypothetical protein
MNEFYKLLKQDKIVSEFKLLKSITDLLLEIQQLKVIKTDFQKVIVQQDEDMLREMFEEFDLLKF